MRRPCRLQSLAIAAAAILLACGDETTAPPDDFLPIISNTWRNTADAAHTFSLASGDDGEASGTFTGTETHPHLGNSDIEGAFQNSVVTEFTLKRSTGDLTYTGRFLHADTLRLTRGSQIMVITRGVN